MLKAGNFVKFCMTDSRKAWVPAIVVRVYVDLAISAQQTSRSATVDVVAFGLRDSPTPASLFCGVTFLEDESRVPGYVEEKDGMYCAYLDAAATPGSAPSEAEEGRHASACKPLELSAKTADGLLRGMSMDKVFVFHGLLHRLGGLTTERVAEWRKGDDMVAVHGQFTPEQLAAIAWKFHRIMKGE